MPDYSQMIEDALAGKIDYILIKSISRFSRNTVDCLQYVRMLREKGVYLHFEKENIDTSSAYSEMLMTVLAAFAQEESVSISENIAWSFRKKYEAGIPRRFVLFGYRLDEDGEYRIVGEEAAVVRCCDETMPWNVGGVRDGGSCALEVCGTVGGVRDLLGAALDVGEDEGLQKCTAAQ